MKPLFALALIALPVAAYAQMPPPPHPPLKGTLLEVSATGESQRTPDVATISAGVVTQAANAGKAMADNAKAMTATIAALRARGIADRDIRTASLRLNPQYRYADNQPPVLTGYQATNQVSVRLRDIAKAGDAIDALVAAGANQIDGPNLAVDKPEAGLDEARTAAIGIARARAELYARAAGLKVGRILRISEGGAGVEQPMQPMMIRVTASKRDSTPIAAGEQTLTVTVSVSFELE